MLLSVVVME